MRLRVTILVMLLVALVVPTVTLFAFAALGPNPLRGYLRTSLGPNPLRGYLRTSPVTVTHAVTHELRRIQATVALSPPGSIVQTCPAPPRHLCEFRPDKSDFRTSTGQDSPPRF